MDEIKKILDGWNNRGNFQIMSSENGLMLNPENEEEKKLMKEIEKTVIQKISRESKKNPNVSIDKKETRNRLTLKKVCEEYLDYKSKLVSDKVMFKYNQSVEYLYIYFTHKKNVKDITTMDANNFREFLLEVPTRWKTKPDLKDKNLKLLVEKKSKLLDKYPKNELRTIDEVIVKCKTIFEYFTEKTYINSNPFGNMKKIGNKGNGGGEPFTPSEFRSITDLMKKNNLIEEHNFMVFNLYTGLRRGEICKITIEDIKKDYIIINGTKTDNAKRIIPIHKDLYSIMEQQTESKLENDFLFFNDLKNKYNKKVVGSNREEKIGQIINDNIKLIIKDEQLKKKKHIHSLRKNFSQIIFISDIFNQLEIDSLIGHSNNSVLDVHYLRGLRDYKKLKEKIDKVDFSEYYKVYNEDIDKLDIFL